MNILVGTPLLDHCAGYVYAVIMKLQTYIVPVSIPYLAYPHHWV